MAKPTGTIGSYIIKGNTDAAATGTFGKIPFSGSKSSIEEHIVERFFFSMNKHLSEVGESFILSNPQANRENDFDFTVSTLEGGAYLELQEIAPLTGPHDAAPEIYDVYAFAKSIYEKILEKFNHYKSKSSKDIYLLLYVTNQFFIPTSDVISCLRVWCKVSGTSFRAIFLYVPQTDKLGSPYWIYPVPPELVGNFNPEVLRKVQNLRIDLRSAETFEENGSTKVRIRISSEKMSQLLKNSKLKE